MVAVVEVETIAQELAEFHLWTQEKDLMYSLRYGADGLFEIHIFSSAESDEFYVKKISSPHLFIKLWEER